MTSLTLYIHGQGITSETAHAQSDWVRDTTGLNMTPLLYRDVVESEPVSILGLPLRAPLATTADRQLGNYLAALDPDSDDAARMRLPNRDVTLGHLYETYRSTLRYLTRKSLNEEVRASLLQQIQAAGEAAGDQSMTLVAHSLGTVIALDLLQDLPPTIRVDRLITIGSPLGLIAALPGPWAEFMMPLDRRSVTMPWYDLAADGDLLATFQRIQRRRHFAAGPLTVTTVLGAFDDPHESYFLVPEVARAWVATCR